MTITYRPFGTTDVRSSIELWRDRMAEGYPDAVLLHNSAEGVAGYVATAATAENHLVGFAAGHIGAFANVVAVPYVEICAENKFEPTEQVGHLAIVCVAERFEGQGIGSKLVSEVLAGLLKFELPVVAQVWHSSGRDGGDLVESFGFEQTFFSSDYWQYVTNGYGECPECRTAPCECPGTLFAYEHAEADRAEL